MNLQRKAYSEVYALLQLMSLDLKNKIPNNVLKSIDNKRDKRYEIKIDDLANYEFSEDANFLLGVLYKNYFASTFFVFFQVQSFSPLFLCFLMYIYLIIDRFTSYYI